jgi:Spy/CpxP family protein refolding chaperone
MNRMRLMALALGLFATTPVVAQRPDSAEVKERLAKISKELALTPQQKEQLKPILQQEVADLRAVKDKYKADPSAAGKENAKKDAWAVQQKYAPQINAVLTPEQQAKWKKMKEEKMNEHKKPAY